MLNMNTYDVRICCLPSLPLPSKERIRSTSALLSQNYMSRIIARIAATAGNENETSKCACAPLIVRLQDGRLPYSCTLWLEVVKDLKFWTK